MSGPLRSKQGCWTCRLRKKKCDEGRPHCSTCDSLLITCYGFGPKPEWMNDPGRERAVANSLKEIVKHTSRRKTTTQSSKEHNIVIRIAPKSSTGPVECATSGPEPNSQSGFVTPPLDPKSSQENGANLLQNESTSSSLAERCASVTGPVVSLPADESFLLMHFLDHAFPLQYPMYKPGIDEGGRGWLLDLLFRTKSLYHGALALSLHHRRMTTLGKTSQPCQIALLVQQEKHLETCIKLVNQFASNGCSQMAKNGLGVVTAVLQLAFFELFTGHDDAWQPHLRAVMNMYEAGYKSNLTKFGLTEKSKTVLLEDLPLLEYEPVVAGEILNFRFLTGTVFWLDIISSITAGTTPHFLSYHSSFLAPNSQTKLENFMGCKNWVMLQIGRIAALHEGKIQAMQQPHFDCEEAGQTVVDIRREIQRGLTQEAFEGFNIADLDSPTRFNAMSDPHTLATRIFAYMASIYLHLVIHGFQKLELLDTTISGAMRMLHTQIPISLLTALIAPLYVIGTVAREEDKQFLRNSFSSPPLLDPVLKHRERILPNLGEIWSRRQTTPSFAWEDSLKIAKDILLI